MPDWAMTTSINARCPIIPHDHRQANSEEIKIINRLNRKHLIGINSYCAICNPLYNSTIKLGWKCPNYHTVEIIPIDETVKETLYDIFNNHPVFFLPELVHEKIFRYASIHYIDVIDNLNRNTIDHLFNCNLCVEKTLKWITFNCCTKHQLPRFKNKNIHRIRFS